MHTAQNLVEKSAAKRQDVPRMAFTTDAVPAGSRQVLSASRGVAAACGVLAVVLIAAASINSRHVTPPAFQKSFRAPASLLKSITSADRWLPADFVSETVRAGISVLACPTPYLNTLDSFESKSHGDLRSAGGGGLVPLP